MARYLIQLDAVTSAEASQMADGLLSSPLYARSPLAGGFRGSYGLAWSFRRADRALAEGRFPSLTPFLRLLLDGSPERFLEPWWRRQWRRAPSLAATNAFYANFLVLGPGERVGRHTDATLREPSGLPDCLPRLVSVLYLRAPLAGGELVLWSGARRVATVRPRVGALVHFEGSLEHEVLPFEGTAGELRISLVLEQYQLTPLALERLKFRTHSRASFTAHLTSHREGER